MIKIKKIKPMFNGVLITMNKNKADIVSSTGLINPDSKKDTLKQFQRVVAIGTTVRDISVGDIISFNPDRFAVKQHNEGSLKNGIISDNPVVSYTFNVIVVNDKPCILLSDRDIEYIVEEYKSESTVKMLNKRMK